LPGAFVGRDQRGRFLHQTLGGENFAERPALDVGRRQAHRLRGEAALGVGLEFDEELAGFIVRRRREIQARDDVRQRPACDLRSEHPAVDRFLREAADDGRQHLFEILARKARPAVMQRRAQGRELGGARLQLRPALAIEIAEKVELCGRKLVQRHFHLVAEVQLFLEPSQGGKGLGQGFDMRAVDAQFHRGSGKRSGDAGDSA
jgi:hypothetical protein